MRITILGCGSSGGVPRIGNQWGACDPKNPKNKRRRCSILVELISGADRTRVLIDSSPDLREQFLSEDITNLDAVLYTHEHADHTHGLDDLRMVAMHQKERLPVWADKPTANMLFTRFKYAFETPKGSDYPPILTLNEYDGPLVIEGAAGPLEFETMPLQHGRIIAQGIRMNNVAYCPDVHAISDDTWHQLRDLDCWIIDALRYKPHPSHAHLDRTLEWIKHANPKRAVLTNLHIDMDYEILNAETAPNIEPAYDGMRLKFLLNTEEL